MMLNFKIIYILNLNIRTKIHRMLKKFNKIKLIYKGVRMMIKSFIGVFNQQQLLIQETLQAILQLIEIIRFHHNYNLLTL